MTGREPSLPPTMFAIKAAVAHEYGVSVTDLESARRASAVARPRQTAMWLCRHLTGRRLSDIGRSFGDRVSATVSHALLAVERRMLCPDEAVRIERLMASIAPGAPVRRLAAARAEYALREVAVLIDEVDALGRRLRRMEEALRAAVETKEGDGSWD